MPAEQLIDLGRAAHMQCLTEERDRAAITWTKDGRALATSGRVSAAGQTLQILAVQREDYGVYQCFVTRGGREVAAAAQLRLGDAAPRLVYEFIEQTLQPGPGVTLKCSCRGSPTPQISWTKNGFPLAAADTRYKSHPTLGSQLQVARRGRDIHWFGRRKYISIFFLQTFGQLF